MLYSNDRSQKEIVRIYCPVCSSNLGTKFKGEVKSFDCTECDHTYYFFALDTTKPRAEKINHKKRDGCGCGRCDN